MRAAGEGGGGSFGSGRRIEDEGLLQAAIARSPPPLCMDTHSSVPPRPPHMSENQGEWDKDAEELGLRGGEGARKKLERLERRIWTCRPMAHNSPRSPRSHGSCWDFTCRIVDNAAGGQPRPWLDPDAKHEMRAFVRSNAGHASPVRLFKLQSL